MSCETWNCKRLFPFFVILVSEPGFLWLLHQLCLQEFVLKSNKKGAGIANLIMSR